MRKVSLLLTLALLAAALLSPFETQAISEMANFDHPESLPDQASDNARDALEARGTQGGEGNGGDDGDNGDENAAEVENS
ncbi:MAG: hypothetical protein HY518_00135, partial [Candidatus Aenigmarchaeota archaeon]|nr:hypothetical protein [Candidatus Aenigmarchaeota archaeon]